MKPLISPPDILSLLRIILLPAVVVSADFDHPILALLLLCAACLSDVLDGKLARTTGIQSRFGEGLDVICDFFFILGLMIYLNVQKILPLYPILLVFLSIGTFAACCLARGSMNKNPIGRHTGSVLYGMLCCFFAAEVIPSISSRIPAAVVFASIFLVISIVENLILLRGRRRITYFPAGTDLSERSENLDGMSGNLTS